MIGRWWGAVVLSIPLQATCTVPVQDVGEIYIKQDQLIRSGEMVVNGQVRDLTVVAGHLVLLTTVAPHVTVMSPRGEVRSQFSPEHGSPWTVIATAEARDDSTLVLWDAIGNERQTYNLDGERQGREELFPRVYGTVRADVLEATIGDPFRMKETLDGRVIRATYLNGLTTTADHRLSSLVSAGPEISSSEPLLSFREILKPTSVDPVVSPVPLWDVCSSRNQLVLFHPDEREVKWLALDPTLAEEMSETVPGNPIEMEFSDYYRAQLWMAEQSGAFGSLASLEVIRLVEDDSNLRARMPGRRVLPIAIDLRCDPGGRIWVRLFERSAKVLGRGRSWLVKSSQESRWTKIVFPAAFEPYDFGPDHVWGVVTDGAISYPASTPIPPTRATQQGNSE